jgi:ankyrin repeat protein
LILAVENGHFQLAQTLLEQGAKANSAPSGYTALHALTWVRKPIRGDGDPPPVGSGKLSSLNFVRKLVAAGANINARYEKGETGRGKFTIAGSTSFLLAARCSDLPLAQLLLELGADPKLPNSVDCTPLLAATGVGALGDGDETAGTEQEAIEMVHLLLKLGADVNAVDKNGETAMHGAAYQDRAQLITLLAESGADINVWNHANKAGWTPLVIAVGYRPGNFRPEPDTIAALHKIMLANGVQPPTDPKPIKENPN